MKNTIRTLLFKIIVLASICLMLILPLTLQAEIKDLHAITNNKYVLDKTTDNTIVITDIANNKVIRKHFDGKIDKAETCANYPFASLICQSHDSSTYYYIYDLSSDRVYRDKQRLYIDNLEQRWSADGKYTYLRNETSFTILETKYLRAYLDGKNNLPSLTVTGHPLGYIWQVKWSGNILLYASGVDDRECLGLLNIETGCNYFITCCGMVDNTRFSKPCGSADDFDIDELTRLTEPKELPRISNDFYNEALDLINK